MSLEFWLQFPDASCKFQVQVPGASSKCELSSRCKFQVPRVKRLSFDCKFRTEVASLRCELQVPSACFESQNKSSESNVWVPKYEFQVYMSPKKRVLSPEYESDLIGSMVHVSCKVLISGWQVSITSPKHEIRVPNTSVNPLKQVSSSKG